MADTANADVPSDPDAATTSPSEQWRTDFPTATICPVCHGPVEHASGDEDGTEAEVRHPGCRAEAR